MDRGKAIPVWYPEEDRRRVEEAAALAGYQHLSKYIRDKSLGRGGHQEAGRGSVQAWANREEFVDRLTELERGQKTSQALLAMLLFLVRKKATTGEFNEMVLACANAGVPADMLAAAVPELAELLTRVSVDT